MKLIFATLFFCLIAGVGVSTAQTQDRSETRLMAQFDEMLTNQYGGNQPGATVLIARYGDVIYRKAFGMADLELNVRMK